MLNSTHRDALYRLQPSRPQKLVDRHAHTHIYACTWTDEAFIINEHSGKQEEIMDSSGCCGKNKRDTQIIIRRISVVSFLFHSLTSLFSVPSLLSFLSFFFPQKNTFRFQIKSCHLSHRADSIISMMLG